MTRARSTIRWRLTAFYGLIFFLCGAAILVVSYVVVRQSLIADEQRGAALAAELYGLDREGVEEFLRVPLPGPVQGPDGETVETVGEVIDGVQVQTREDVLDDLLLGTGLALGAMVVLGVLAGWTPPPAPGPPDR
ncbi:MAG: hypothetical protein U5R31_03390 [Acidimicrobiia bacterium]|nr:hypothetical protein [Acidimicrobiia bacterium]